MCGVFGYIAATDRGPDLRKLTEIAAVTERRGPHAFGFAWIDPAGRLKAFKQTGRITQHLGLLGMARDAVMLIGHCRWATSGDAGNNLNNHPHPADGGWVVHNGVVGNFDRLVRRYDLPTVTDCDTEALTLLIERLPGALVERFARTVRLAAPGGPVALLGLWPRPRRLLAARNGNPLSIGATRCGWYLGSVAEGLPGRVQTLDDGDLVEFTHRKGVTHGRLHQGIADRAHGVPPHADAEELFAGRG